MAFWLRAWSCMCFYYTEARDHKKFNFNFPWYGFWMGCKGFQNFMVTALGQGESGPKCDLSLASTMLPGDRNKE